MAESNLYETKYHVIKHLYQKYNDQFIYLLQILVDDILVYNGMLSKNNAHETIQFFNSDNTDNMESSPTR